MDQYLIKKALTVIGEEPTTHPSKYCEMAENVAASTFEKM